MTALLVLVTLVSLAIAGVLAIYVRQLTRAERERSDANAAALADMIGPAHLEAPASFDASIDLGVGGADQPQQASPVMFGAAEPAAASPRMFLIPAIGLFVVIAALSAIYAWNRSSTQRGGRRGRVRGRAAGARRAATPAPRRRDGDFGPGAQPAWRTDHPARCRRSPSRSTGRASFLASGRAPLDFPLLQPGDESPFTVTVPNSPAIGRYRVTFRTESGVVPHVDRRSDSQVALQPSREPRMRTDVGTHGLRPARRKRARDEAIPFSPHGRSGRHRDRGRRGADRAAAVAAAERRRLSLSHGRRADQRGGHGHRQRRPLRARPAARRLHRL